MSDGEAIERLLHAEREKVLPSNKISSMTLWPVMADTLHEVSMGRVNIMSASDKFSFQGLHHFLSSKLTLPVLGFVKQFLDSGPGQRRYDLPEWLYWTVAQNLHTYVKVFVKIFVRSINILSLVIYAL